MSPEVSCFRRNSQPLGSGTDVVVGAIAAVNAVGGIYHPDSHQILAGARRKDGQGFRDMMAAIIDGYRVVASPSSNTTIGTVATNVPFSKTEISKIAQMAHDRFACRITPRTRCPMMTRSLSCPPASIIRPG